MEYEIKLGRGMQATQRNADLVADQEAGMPIAELTAKYKLGRCRIYQIVSRYGTPIRERALAEPEKVERKIIKAMKGQPALSRRDIAKIAGVDPESALLALRRLRCSDVVECTRYKWRLIGGGK